MPLEPTPERQLVPDEETEIDNEVIIETDCCYKKMPIDDTTLVKRVNGYGRFCESCLIEFENEIKICE
jgi:hypothetical protein